MKTRCSLPAIASAGGPVDRAGLRRYDVIRSGLVTGAAPVLPTHCNDRDTCRLAEAFIGPARPDHPVKQHAAANSHASIRHPAAGETQKGPARHRVHSVRRDSKRSWSHPRSATAIGPSVTETGSARRRRPHQPGGRRQTSGPSASGASKAFLARGSIGGQTRSAHAAKVARWRRGRCKRSSHAGPRKEISSREPSASRTG